MVPAGTGADMVGDAAMAGAVPRAGAAGDIRAVTGIDAIADGIAVVTDVASTAIDAVATSSAAATDAASTGAVVVMAVAWIEAAAAVVTA